jgi:hypothetical protein
MRTKGEVMMKLYMLVIASLALFGCSNSDHSSEFVGKWVDIHNVRHTFDVEKNGNGLMIHEKAPNLFSNKTIVSNNVPATVKDGMMSITVDGGNVNFAVDKSSGHLTSSAGEFERSTVELEQKAKVAQAAAEKPFVNPFLHQ